MTLPTKVASGDRGSYPAGFFNLQIDMARDYLSTDRGSPAAFRQIGGQWAYVKNDSGGDRKRFDALRITGIIVSPTQRLEEFQQNFAFVVGTGGAATDPIMVLLEPIKAGKVGRALIEGMTPARVNVTDGGYKFASLDNLSVGRLKTTAGGVEIVYKAGSSGEHWAVVRLGGQQQAKLYVAKTDTSGITAASGDTPGSGVCILYKRSTSTGNLVSLGSGVSETIRNAIPQAVGASKYILVVEDVFGDFWVVTAPC